MPGGLILFHGAGSDREHHTFLALEALGERVGLPVARVNFPYRRKGPGRRPPDRMPRLVETVAEAAAECSLAWGCEQGDLVLGGRSMGGRAASVAIAEGQPARGLLLLSYPLHPPGKPDKLRIEHLDQITCPVLLVHGTRDPFGSVDEMEHYLPVIPGPVERVWLDANHGPAPKFDDQIVTSVADWLAAVSGAGGRGSR